MDIHNRCGRKVSFENVSDGYYAQCPTCDEDVYSFETNDEKFDLVKKRALDAKAITWDNCHKIYLLMDDFQIELMRGYGYDPIITKDEMTPDEMFETLKEWYANSCSLRFIDAVSTHPVDPNYGFETLIGQFEYLDEEEAS